MNPLVDTHAHLQGSEFQDDIGAVLERANQAGVGQIIVPAVDLATAQSAIAMTEDYAGIFATAGCHPHEADSLTQAAVGEIETLLGHPKVVAVGEIGLDFFRHHSDPEIQIEAFQVMLSLAEKRAKPVVIHCRDAWDQMRPLLQPWARRACTSFGSRPVGVLHYFSSTVEEALEYVELGFMIAIHTSVTHPKAELTREVAKAVPLEFLVIETDSPYGAPQAFRGKRNEPAFVREAARQLCELRGIDKTEVASVTTNNALRLFQLQASEPAKPFTRASI